MMQSIAKYYKNNFVICLITTKALIKENVIVISFMLIFSAARI